jgi:hypothetical protein
MEEKKNDNSLLSKRKINEKKKKRKRGEQLKPCLQRGNESKNYFFFPLGSCSMPFLRSGDR